MMHLLFQMGEEAYAIPVARIERVLPLVALRRIPRTPDWVAGVMIYRGQPVPVVDVCRRALGRGARALLDTRIVLVGYPEGGTRRLGLILEHVRRVAGVGDADVAEIGLRMPEAPYPGGAARRGAARVRRIEVDQLLPGEMKERLFEAAEEVTHEP